MRRLILGIVILGLLLSGSWAISWALDAVHSPVAQQLEQAADAADREDWAAAERLAQAAQAQWDRYWRFTAAVADHTPMDQLDGLFGELTVYLEHREQPHFSASCKHLAQLATAMADSHCPSWWNII